MAIFVVGMYLYQAPVAHGALPHFDPFLSELLNGDVTANGSSLATITGKVALGNSTRNFTVAPGTAANLLVAGVISGNGGLTKLGLGLMKLTGANTYSGLTSVNAGTLEVDGSLLSTGSVA